jgi:Protein of unknown function (DUF3572)
MQRGEAELLGLKALTWLAGDQEALLRFLAGSGLERNDLRRRASEPELLAAILDFLLADDALLTAFSAEQRIKPASVHEARRQLPGGGGEV